jgi:tetratricopeptide (TPR) repeat protein
MADTFTADPHRDASAVIRGFVYQVDITIQRWLELQENERLELERGEDIDIIAIGIASNTEEQRITEQVKSREENLTLRSAAAVQSVANFALHRERNPNFQLRFRFTTNARAGIEQGAAFPASAPGIVAWRRVQSRTAAESEETAIAGALRDFYRQLRRPNGIADNAWEALKRIVSADERQWVAFLSDFEWAVENDSPGSLACAVRERIVASRLADVGTAEPVYQRLFVHVFRLLSTDGEKVLSRQRLGEVVSTTSDAVTHAQVVTLLDRMTSLERRMELGEQRLSGVEEANRTLSIAFGGMASAAAAAAQLPSVGVVPLTLTTDPPPTPPQRISRSVVVQRLRDEFPSGWLALYGDTGSGKSQLAHLLAEQAAPFFWLRFTDMPPALAGIAWRQFLESTASLGAASSRATLLTALFGVASAKMIVLDDLPRLDSRSPFTDDLLALAQTARGAGVLIVSTSLHRLPRSIQEGIGDAIGEVATPSFSEDEVEEVSIATGAPAETARTLAPLIHTIGQGNPALVVGIARHLRRSNWLITAEELLRILTGDHEGGTRRELLARLLASIVEEPTRQLLYRMMLAIGDLSIDEVRGLADAPPSIDLPVERLSQLEGLWLQVEDDRHIRIPALVRLLSPADLPAGVLQFCYARLALMRMRRRQLTPPDVIKVVMYFTSAGMHYQAGLAASQGFMELERLGPIPDSGLSDLFMWPLSDEMPAGIKLLVRGTQLGMLLKWKKDASFPLKDIDGILASTDDPFQRSGAIIPAGKLLTADTAAAWKALPLLRQAMAAHDEGRAANLPVVPIPDELWAQSVFIAGNSVGSEEGLRELQQTIKMLPASRRTALDAIDELEQMFVSIPSNFYLAMYRQSAESQNWQSVVEAMRTLSAWAIEHGWPLLHAHAMRIMLVVFGEDQNDVEQVLRTGTASADATTDAQSRGLIEATVARQLNLKNRTADARTWYARALSRPPSSIAQLEFNALVDGSKAEQEFSLATSIAYLERAVTVTDSSEDLVGPSGQFSARAELAVALLLNGDLDRALSLWDEAGRLLLVNEPEDDVARGRIAMFLAHCPYFYYTAAGLIGAMQFLPLERRPVAPAIGQFHADLHAFGTQLDSSSKGRVAFLLGKLSSARGDQAQAARYGQMALDAFDGIAGLPSSMLDEANRLANGTPSDSNAAE